MHSMDRDQALREAMSLVGRTRPIMVIFPNTENTWSVVSYDDYDYNKVKNDHHHQVRFVLPRYEVTKLS